MLFKSVTVMLVFSSVPLSRAAICGNHADNATCISNNDGGCNCIWDNETCTKGRDCDGAGITSVLCDGNDACSPAEAAGADGQATCVDGDHCMCTDGFLCADTKEEGACTAGTGDTVFCVLNSTNVITSGTSGLAEPRSLAVLAAISAMFMPTA